MRTLAGGLAALSIVVASCAVTIDGPSPTALPPEPTTTAGRATTTSAPRVSTAEAVAGFEACLRESGLAIESIPFDAAGRPRLDLVMPDVDYSDQIQVEALATCSRLLMSGAIDLMDDDELQALVLAALHDFADCVRGHGVEEFPDPFPEFTGVGVPFPPEAIPFEDPALETATRICAERLGS